MSIANRVANKKAQQRNEICKRQAKNKVAKQSRKVNRNG